MQRRKASNCTDDEAIIEYLMFCLNYILESSPYDEWEDWWENEDDPIGPDDPDDYMSEADE